MVEYTTEDISRFWLKVNKTETCWLWAGSFGSRNRDYGFFFAGGKSHGAHRVAYELIKGEIPEGLCIDHLCRNTHCVNPNHLEAVTFSVNTMRGYIARGKTRTKKNYNKKVNKLKEIKTHCKNGHELNEENTGFHSYTSPKGKILGPYQFCRICWRAKSRENWHTKYKMPLLTAVT
jgi:hypothetical protein